jgi:Protein of unknown function (DUF3617)
MKLTMMATAAAAMLAATIAVAQSPIREGNWEVSIQMQIPNMPMQMPAQKVVRCITRKDLETPGGDLPGSADKDSKCTTSNRKVEGNKITWDMACTGRAAMNGTGEIVVDGDTYTGTMKMNGDMGAMTMKYDGKRLGDCTQ